jgi:hypothetical protein
MTKVGRKVESDSNTNSKLQMQSMPCRNSDGWFDLAVLPDLMLIAAVTMDAIAATTGCIGQRCDQTCPVDVESFSAFSSLLWLL